MIVRFIGCLHLCHESIAKHRGFSSAEEHDDHLISQWNSGINNDEVMRPHYNFRGYETRR